ncbi:MAG: hypothetical protein OEW67_10540 [Cyclobacteriaceae bacterium]|nr:hypothetical protein [Cyclobacteriaceae bacterium]
MSLENRFKAYIIIAVLLCVLGILLNMSSGNTTGLGGIFITTGGISLVLGITIKRKYQERQNSSEKDLTSPE